MSDQKSSNNEITIHLTLNPKIWDGLLKKAIADPLLSKCLSEYNKDVWISYLIGLSESEIGDYLDHWLGLEDIFDEVAITQFGHHRVESEYYIALAGLIEPFLFCRKEIIDSMEWIIAPKELIELDTLYCKEGRVTMILDK